MDTPAYTRTHMRSLKVLPCLSIIFGNSTLATEPVPECPADLTPTIRVAPKNPTSPISFPTDNYVLIRLRVETDGTTTKHELLYSSARQFEEPALEAVRQWRYASRKYSCPLVVRLEFPVRVRTDDE